MNPALKHTSKDDLHIQATKHGDNYFVSIFNLRTCKNKTMWLSYEDMTDKFNILYISRKI